MPQCVDHAQRRVAVLYRVRDNPQRRQIVNLIEPDLLPPHLLENRIRPFDSPIDARRNSFFAQTRFDRLTDLGQEFLARMTAVLHIRGDLTEFLRLQMLKREVLKFIAHLSHAQAVRDRRIQIQGLPGNPLPPLRGQTSKGPHVMRAVGQLHQDDAKVLDHRQHHLTEALGLTVLRRRPIQLAQLGDAIHAVGHFRAEFLADTIDLHARVFHHVMQQPGLERHHVHLHVGENAGDHDGMDYVRVPGCAHLSFVALPCEQERLSERRQIFLGALLANLRFKLAIQGFHGIAGRQWRRCFREAGGFGWQAISILAMEGGLK